MERISSNEVGGSENSKNPEKSGAISAFNRIYDLVFDGMIGMQAIHVAVKLGIADLLKNGPKSIDELAVESKLDPFLLYRLLRALSALGVFQELPDKKFQLNSVSEVLRGDHPQSIKASMLLMGSLYWNSWGNLYHVITTGETAFKFTYGKEFFEFLLENPDKYKLFNTSMTQISRLQIPIILKKYDFSSYEGAQIHLLVAQFFDQFLMLLVQ